MMMMYHRSDAIHMMMQAMLSTLQVNGMKVALVFFLLYTFSS